MDFTYEVSRALAACEGALLVVDASQGIEAQTLANVYMALDHDLEIHPGDQQNRSAQRAAGCGTARKLRMKSAWIRRAAPLVSAKQGIGIEDVLEDIVADHVPAAAVATRTRRCRR